MRDVDAGSCRATVLLYPGCIFFEIAAAAELLAPRCRLHYLTPDGRDHAASNGSRMRADGPFARLETQQFDAVLIPGGNPDSILDAGTANRGLRAAAERGAVLAGICAGALVLAGAGLLRGRRATHNYTLAHTTPEVVAATAPFWQGMAYEAVDLVVDGRIITANHWAHRRFAVAVGMALGLLTPAQGEEALQRFRDHHATD